MGDIYQVDINWLFSPSEIPQVCVGVWWAAGEDVVAYALELKVEPPQQSSQSQTYLGTRKAFEKSETIPIGCRRSNLLVLEYGTVRIRNPIKFILAKALRPELQRLNIRRSRCVGNGCINAGENSSWYTFSA